MPKYFLDHELPQFIKFLDAPGQYFVQELNGELIGCGGYYLNKDNTVSLCWGMVHHHHHGTGMGKALLEFRLQKIALEYPNKIIVNVTSQYTTGFFERYGFKTVSIKKDGFGPGLDECKMVKEIITP